MSTILQMHRHRVLESKAQGDQSEFLTCPACGAVCSRRELARSLSVCPQCGHHFPIGAYYRLSMLLDSGSFRELKPRLHAGDPLSFPGYREKLRDSARKTGPNEAVVTAVGTICSHKCVAVEALFTALALRDGFIPAAIPSHWWTASQTMNPAHGPGGASASAWVSRIFASTSPRSM